MSESRTPGRLLDPASQCSPLGRDLLRAARADAPSQRRTSAVVAAALASAPAPQAGATPHASGIRPTRGAVSGVSTVAKVVAGVGLAGCAAFFLIRGRAVDTTPAPVPTVTSLLPSEPLVAPQPHEAASVEREPPTVSVDDLPRATPLSTTSAPLREVSPPAEQTSLEAELAQLRAAREAIRRGAPQDALDRLAAYSHEFPNGLLKPEAEALAIEAEIAAGRTALARRDADAFLAAHADSPQAPRIRRMREQLEP